MSKKIFLPAGESFSGDANIRYPKGQILNVKGFYDQNSHVMPDGFKEYKKELVKGSGKDSSWGEYVPESYDGSKAVPLVISRHGGGQSGWGQCFATSWCFVADREGFIVVYPDAQPMKRPPAGERPSFSFQLRVPEEDFAIQEMIALIEEIKGKYNIDESRIFMQGMSMGDLMTMQFALARGDLLAGISESAGPAPADEFFDENGNPLPYKTFVPAFVSFVSNNNMGVPADQRPADPLEWKEMKNLAFWKAVNGACDTPKLKVDGIENYMYFCGEKAPVGYRDVLGRGHGQTFDDADMVWSTFFSGLKREADGSVSYTAPKEENWDKNAVALADGAEKAYVDNKFYAVDGKTYYREIPFIIPMRPGQTEAPKIEKPEGYDPVLYAPVTLLAALGCKVDLSKCKKYATIVTPAGDLIKVSAGNTGVTVNNRIYSLERYVENDDEMLYVPVKWFAHFMGKHVAERDGVMYINDKYGALTENMAALIKQLLK